MRAIVFEQAGDPGKVLVARDVGVPSPGAGEVLIQVAARPIDPADLYFIEGRYRIKPTFPQVAGLDGAGIVTAFGTGVTTVPVGTRVAFRSPGAWAEFAVAPVSRIHEVPSGIPDDIACQFALNPLTAWALLAESGAQSGARVLATAGRSVVARLMAALSRRRAIRLTLLVRDGEGVAALDGADGSLVARADTVQALLPSLTTADGFRAILDAVGGAAAGSLLDALGARGRFVSYGVLDDSPITLRASTMVYRNITWLGFGIDAWFASASPAVRAAAEAELWSLLRDEPDVLPIIGRFPLDHVRDAIQAIHDSRRPGKVLLI